MPIAVVPPDFPKAALAAGQGAKIDLSGTILANGAFVRPKFASDVPQEAAFRKEIEDVIKFWIFFPSVDEVTCIASDVEKHVRVWFEIEGGKPKVSVSSPVVEPKTAPQPNDAYFEKRAPDFPRGRAVYPRSAALDRSIMGADISVLARVDHLGNVVDAWVAPSYSHRDFSYAALAATKRAVFRLKPGALKEGETRCASLLYNFRIRD